MAKPEIFTFEYKEVAELLVKQQDIHEGHWAIVFELGLAGGVFAFPPDVENFAPTAVVTIKKIRLQHFDEPTPLTVDAAEVNPAAVETTAEHRKHS
jgi:hypothetical protein